MPTHKQLLIMQAMPTRTGRTNMWWQRVEPASQAVLRGQRGFTMVELMIAMVLSLFLLGAITFVVVNSNKNYNTTDSLSRLQENARFAMEFITRDFRRTGHAGCLNDMRKINNGLNASAYGNQDAFESWVAPVDGIENVGGAGVWAESGQSYTSGAMALIPSTVTNQVAVSGSDAVGIRYVSNDDAPAVAVPMDNESADVVVEDNGTKFNKGDIVMITSCSGGDIFQVTDVANNPGQIVLSHAAGGGFNPGNASGALKIKYGNYGPESERRSTVVGASMIAYYVATNTTTGQRALYRDSPGDGNKEIVEGVDSLQVSYGLANDPDNSNPSAPPQYPTSYVKADDAALISKWPNVVSVRFGVLVSTMANTSTGQYGTDVDTGNYTVNGETVTPPAGERRLRRVFENTVMLRNHL